MSFYHSTRSGASSVTSKQAILTGIAPDGGLYVSDELGEKRVSLETVCGPDLSRDRAPRAGDAA